MHGLALTLVLATIMMTWTVAIHFFGIVFLLRLLSKHSHRVAHLSEVFRQILLLLFAVLGIVALHTAEIWSYALVYLQLGAISDFEPALYFSSQSCSRVRNLPIIEIRNAVDQPNRIRPLAPSMALRMRHWGPSTMSP